MKKKLDRGLSPVSHPINENVQAATSLPSDHQLLLFSLSAILLTILEATHHPSSKRGCHHDIVRGWSHDKPPFLRSPKQVVYFALSYLHLMILNYL